MNYNEDRAGSLNQGCASEGKQRIEQHTTGPVENTFGPAYGSKTAYAGEPAKEYISPNKPQHLADPMIGIGGAPTRNTTLPTDGESRKQFPLASGLLDYFPDALAAVAHLSWKGNQQHNPGEPLHWARSKSADEADTLLRHMTQRGTRDTDGIRHSVKVAWRALAMLQKEIEETSMAVIIHKQRESERAYQSKLVDEKNREYQKQNLIDTFSNSSEETLRDIESALNIVAQRRARNTANCGSAPRPETESEHYNRRSTE